MLAVDVADGRRQPWMGAVAGALLGLGAVMRQELLVYALTIVAAVCISMAVRRRLVAAVVAGASSVAGLGAVWLLNARIESTFGGASRGDRASATLSGAVESETATRIEEGLRTTFAISSANEPVAIVLGIVFVIIVATAARYVPRLPHDRLPLVVAVLSLPFLAVVMTGLGFVSGLFAAFPVASAALAFRGGRRAGIVTVVAVVSLPIVWAFQLLGGAGPQWGGRYVLLSGFLLGVVGVVTLCRDGMPAAARNTVIAVSLGVTLFGVVWLVHRSHEVDRFFDEVIEVQEDALIGRNQFFLREVGQRSLDERWLSAPRDGALDGPVRVLSRAGVERFSVLQRSSDPDPELEGTSQLGVDEIDLFGRTFEVRHYQFD
ncbi:MAG: hypothetical protein U5K30_00635 [Acidimicrobiales bacterium]|nr:hypothetical protein [Acidimicrobiales bacterium]